MLMKSGCPVIVSPQRTTWPSLTSRSASATWTSSSQVRGTLRPFWASRSFRYTKTDAAGEWPTPYVLPSHRQRLRNASTRLSLGIESARSSTGRRSPFAANETHVIGWPWAASGGAPAASAAVSFFSRSPQASPSILTETSGCVFSYSAATWFSTARVCGSVSVCHRRITFLSAASARTVTERRRTKPGSAAARARDLIMVAHPSLGGGGSVAPSPRADKGGARVRRARSLRHGERTLEDELLSALPGVHLGRVDIAPGVHGEVVHPVERTRLAPVPPKLCEDFAALAQERPHVVVLTVGVVEPGLGRVVRDVHVPHRAAAARRGRDDELLDEGAVLLEDLDAVVAPVADVEEPVPGEPDAVDRVAEGLHARVAGRTAVGAPVALVGAGPGVEDDDAVVLVPVCHEELVHRGIHRHVGGAAEMRGVAVAARHARRADLEQELPVAREFQYLVVLLTVAADPDGVLGVHVDPVLVQRPVVALARAAPRLEEIPIGVELEDGRRRRTAERPRR